MPKDPKSSNRLSEKAFKSYIDSKRILIADSNSSSRAGLARALVDMGSRMDHIALCGSFGEANQYLKKNSVDLVISDYYLGRDYGLELLQHHRASHQNQNDALFILITANSSQSAVAEAVEEDVDAYILKPYTLERLRQVITQTAFSKIYPTEYQQRIDESKNLIARGDLENAKEILQIAIDEGKAPALACYYYGEIYLQQKEPLIAEQSYRMGLNFNGIHFKCLTALHSILKLQEKLDEAYEILKKISRVFPTKSDRLQSVIQLAVQTGNYKDVQEFYNLFTALDENRSQELIRYVFAGLFVYAKHCILNGSVDRALEVLKQAAVTSGGEPKLLSRISELMAEQRLYDEIGSILNRFSGHSRSDSHYKLASFFYARSDLSPSHFLERGLKLVHEGVKSPVLYRELIETAVDLSNQRVVEDLTDEALALWPEHRDKFESPKQDQLRDEGFNPSLAS
jgi:CheY-like chemotaxis protein